MKYKLQNVRINRGFNSRGQYEWLQAQLFNDAQPWANPARLPVLTSMTQAYIDMFKEPGDTNLKEIPEYRVEQNGKVTTQVFEVTKVPETVDHVDHVYTMVQPLQGLWRQVYRRDTTINGVVMPKGTPRLGTNGKPLPAVSSLRITMMQGFDPDRNVWYDIENPEDIANLILERGYEQIEVQAAQPAISAAEPAQPSASAATKEALSDAEKAEMQKRIEEMQAMMNK